MTRLKRAILLGYCIFVIFASIVVPWHIEFTFELGTARKPLGFKPVWAELPYTAKIDYKKIALELVLGTGVAGFLLVAASFTSKPSGPPNMPERQIPGGTSESSPASQERYSINDSTPESSPVTGTKHHFLHGVSSAWFAVLSVIAIFIAMAIGGGMGNGLGKVISGAVFSGKTLNAEQQNAAVVAGFEAAADTINESGPTLIDADTRMEKASAGPGPRLTYHYTLLKYPSGGIDPKWLQREFRPVLREKVCRDKEMMPALENGGLFAYAYYGNDGVEIARIEIAQRDCAVSSPDLSPFTSVDGNFE